MTASLLLRNVRPYAGKAVDLLIENGKITQIGVNLSAPAGVAIEDGKGEIVIPGSYFEKSGIYLIAVENDKWRKSKVAIKI